MQVLSYSLGLYICVVSSLLSGCDGLIYSQSLSFNYIHGYHSFWNDPAPGMLIFRNQDDITQHQGFILSNEDVDVDYDTHFVIFYFSGAGDGIDLPEKQELVRVERVVNTISLHYDYEPPEGAGAEEETSPMDIIQVEKSEQFRWDDVFEIVVYYNETEIIRESVDFSTTHTVFLPLIQSRARLEKVF